MFFPFFVARKYHSYKSSSNFINIASKVSLFGIAIGTAALILVISVFNGFENLILSMYNSFDPHIKITSAQGKSFDPLLIEEKINNKSIDALSFVLEEKVLLQYENKEFISTIKGVSSNYNILTEFDSLMIEGHYINDYKRDNVCVVGRGVAHHLALISGSIFNQIKVFLPNRNSSNLLNLSTAFNQSFLLPVGIFSIQAEIDQKYIISPLIFVQELSNKVGLVSSIEIKLNNIDDMLNVQENLIRILGSDYNVQNRFEQQELLYKILNTEKVFVFIILLFIIIIASFNIIGATTMLIIDKKNNIEIFKSMGARYKQIQSVFFNHSMLTICFGMILGLLISLIIGFAQQKYGFISMGSGNFVIEAYPIIFSFQDIIFILSAIFIIGLISSWYPSFVLTKRFFKKNNL